jgi:hypothetical protein
MISPFVLLDGGTFQEIAERRRMNKNFSFSYPCPCGVGAASWVDLEEICCFYPSFQLEDELIVQGERCHVGIAIQTAPKEAGSNNPIFYTGLK